MPVENQIELKYSLKNLLKGKIILILLSYVLISACKTDPTIIEAGYVLKIPEGFDAPLIPVDNPLTEAKINLGKKLFFDPALSVDSTISCGSCHKQEYAFGDNVSISEGVNHTLGFRNAPSLGNIAWSPVMLKDGGNPNLEMQIYVPLETHFEMDFNMVLLVERLSQNQEYVQMFDDVFGKPIDPFGITRALSAFERTLISGNSKYDQYTFQGNKSAMNASEINGMNLFFSNELNCASCHSGYLFTDNTFQNNGYFTDYSADSGRARITWLHDDVGKFRVPSLRNISLTAPYMHDGSITTLNELIDQYELGGSGHENQSEKIQAFTLTVEEKNDLINFLHSLTDETFINDPSFKE
jgi:cytochrome c peroxidase